MMISVGSSHYVAASEVSTIKVEGNKVAMLLKDGTRLTVENHYAESVHNAVERLVAAVNDALTRHVPQVTRAAPKRKPKTA